LAKPPSGSLLVVTAGAGVLLLLQAAVAAKRVSAQHFIAVLALPNKPIRKESIVIAPPISVAVL
jgi:hypothetical protein